MANDTKADKFRASYQFFLKMQNEGKTFSNDDIAEATGWSNSTIRTYRTKKWSDILIPLTNKRFSADVSAFTEEAYVRMMSQIYKQSVEPFKPELSEQVEEFVVKARDSAILSIDIYNRPIAAFRSQGYIVLMIIAWTSLFHAIYEMNGTDYFYKENDGNDKMVEGDKKAWELDRCIDKCGDLISNAAKRNLRLFISLRNKIEHRYVPAFDFDVFGECQAMLLNFESLITEQFGSYYALNNALSLPLQVSSVRSNVQTEVIKKIQSDHYAELKQYIEAYRNSLDDNVFSDSQYSFRVFLIPQLGNHRSSSDCAVEFVRYDPEHPEEFDPIKKDIALIKEKRVPVANQGKYKPQMVCDALTDKLGTKVSITLHTMAWKYYKVREQGLQADGCNTKYCQFDEAHRDYVYTQAWIDFLYDEFRDSDKIKIIRNKK
ncbi:MAG: DUF3644 domain-containing protein [Clostridiales bacterium]|nr:DUF3644 domain-containing protein [Clostridiales bacterium]